MWIVEPELDSDGGHVRSVIHVDTILHSAHLMPVFRIVDIPARFHFF